MKKPASTFALVALMGLFLCGGLARADTFETVAINNAAAGNGPIDSWVLDVTTGTFSVLGSFIPQGAVPGGPNGGSPNGRAIALTNTQFYYTELTNGFGPTLKVETGLFNNGAGGPDNGGFVNPIPGRGIQNLHFGAGGLYIVSGYPSQPPEVFIVDPVTGAITAPSVTLATDPGADGFTILANGNYLVNEGDGDNSYDQYNPLTGARIAGTNISAKGCGSGFGTTGVDTDGTHLFFDCTISSGKIEETDLMGNVIHDFNVGFFEGEGLSLQANFNPPPPNVPEPTSILLLGSVATLVGLKLRRKIA